MDRYRQRQSPLRVRAGAAAAVWALATATAPALPAAAHHGGATAEIAVRANTFDPFEVHVARGGTATWRVLEGGHSIVADDGRFRFPAEDGATLAPGQAPAFTAGQADERVRYYCSVHGGRGGLGMAGVLVVGDPKPPVSPTPVVRVPSDAATLEEAVAVVPPDGRVELAPGTYAVTDTVALTQPRVTVTGTGAGPEAVTIVAAPGSQGLPESVLQVSAAFVAIGNLTVTGARTAGVHLDGAPAAELRQVHVRGERLTRDGVIVTGAQGAGLLDVTVRDVRRAGIRVDSCAACGVSIAGAEVSGALVGVLASGARGVVVRASTLYANAAGIVARGADGRLSTIDVTGNDLTANAARDRLPAPTDADRRLATGAGVHLAGAVDSRVSGNRIAGHRFGVVLSEAAARVTVRDNVLANEPGVDLAWDGVGAQTCFAGHAGTPTSHPPAIQTLYPCDRPSAGVPYPPVPASLLAAAYGP